MPDRLKGIGERLKQARNDAGLKQTEAAEASGVDINSLQNWEIGRAEARVGGLVKLAEFYGVSMDWIVGRVEDRRGIPAGNYVVDADIVDRIEKASTIDELLRHSRIKAEDLWALPWSFRVPVRPVVVHPDEWLELRDRLMSKLRELEGGASK